MPPTNSIRTILIQIALLPLMAAAAPGDDENARLRSEVEQLKTQLQDAQAHCAVSSAAPAAAAAAKQAPTGYKLVKIEPVLPKDDRWKDRRAWDALFKGMSKQDVEDLLGVEHTAVEGNGRSFWGYGKVGPNPASRVIFVDDKLAIWVPPDF